MDTTLAVASASKTIKLGKVYNSRINDLVTKHLLVWSVVKRRIDQLKRAVVVGGSEFELIKEVIK